MSSTSSVTQTDYTEVLVQIYVADLEYSRNPIADLVAMSSARYGLKMKGRESLPYLVKELQEAHSKPESTNRVRMGLAMLLSQIGGEIRYPVPENLLLNDSASWIAWAEEAQANV